MTETTGKPLPMLLARLGAELTRLAADAARLEDMVNDLPWEHICDGAAGMTTIQSLDYFRQSLDGLAAFVGNLGDLAETEWQVNAEAAVAGLKLARLALHLSGFEQAACDDELELFAAG
jgi:hypothetical protein